MQATPLPSTHNQDLLDLLPFGADRIVEFGCSNGALAKAYLAQSPYTQYIGVERCEEYAEQARSVCARVDVMDIELLSVEQLKEYKADCWVLGDVLEHLVDPWEFVMRLWEASRPGAMLAVCVPNMQHWSVLVKLAFGKLYYEPAGLLDKTHLRWFTGETLTAMLHNTGWGYRDSRLRVVGEGSEEEKIALEWVGKLAQMFGERAKEVVEASKIYQYVVLCRKERE